MTCNRCAATTEAVAPVAGAGHIEANWAGNRTAVQQCKDCGAFLRRDGGCTRCEAAKSMTIPAARAAAEQEIRLMREFMARWQAETLRRWAAGPPKQPADEVGRRRKLPLLQALEPEEMLKFQPTIDEFGRRYRDFLQQNAPRRGELFRD